MSDFDALFDEEDGPGHEPPDPPRPDWTFEDCVAAGDAPTVTWVRWHLDELAAGGEGALRLVPTAGGGLEVELRRAGAPPCARRWDRPPLAAGVLNRLKTLAGLDIAERTRPQRGQLEHPTARGPCALDVETWLAPTGEAATLRVGAS